MKKWPQSYDALLIRLGSTITQVALKPQGEAIKKLKSVQRQIDRIIDEIEENPKTKT